MARHALLSASSSDRWLHCPPSAWLCEQHEDKGSAYAAEGTDAHTLCEYKLRKALGIETADPTEHLTWYNEEMEDCANGYASYILELVEAAKETCSDPVVLIEQRVDFSRWVEQGFGTSDAIIIADETLRIVDYKHGQGVLVDADNNSQMKLYALGALELFDGIYDIDRVSKTIYQPRRDNISTHTVFKESLYQWAEDVLQPTAELAYAGDGEFCCGDWCRYCRLRHNCRKLSEANLELAKAIGGYYFASDVKFIFADAGNSKVTVTNGAQSLTDDTDITYCLKTVGSKKEIIAVFAQQTATASANAASELYFFGEVNGTKVVNGKTYNVYSVAKDGMPVDNCYGERSYMPGFYTAEIDKDTGAYTFSAYDNAAGLWTTNTPTLPSTMGGGANPNAPFFPAASQVTDFNAARTAFTIGGIELNTANAKFIRLAPKGLGNATDLANLVTECTLGQHPNKYVVAFAIYDNTTGIASHVYYKLTDANFMVAPVSMSEVTDNSTAVTATAFAVSAPTVIKAGDTITYTLTYDVGASYAGKTDQIVFTAPTGTTLVGSDKADVAATTASGATSKTAVFTVTVDDSNLAGLTVIPAATVTVVADA